MIGLLAFAALGGFASALALAALGAPLWLAIVSYPVMGVALTLALALIVDRVTQGHPDHSDGVPLSAKMPGNVSGKLPGQASGKIAA